MKENRCKTAQNSKKIVCGGLKEENIFITLISDFVIKKFTVDIRHYSVKFLVSNYFVLG